jgi:hypothetical protein
MRLSMSVAIKLVERDVLTFTKKESTRTVAVFLSGSKWVILVFDDRVNCVSTILCLLGSSVKGQWPTTVSTIIRMICRKARVAESPRYTVDR